MLYFNKDYKVVDKDLGFGTLRCVELGSEEMGKTHYLLPVSKDVDTDNIEKGLHSDLTIGTTKSGKPIIELTDSEDDSLYLLLNSYGTYGEGEGVVSTKNTEDVKELICCDAFEEQTDDCGYDYTVDWNIKLLEVPNDGKTRAIRCYYSGDRSRNDNKAYALVICRKNKVDEVWNGYIQDYYDMCDEDIDPAILSL